MNLKTFKMSQRRQAQKCIHMYDSIHMKLSKTKQISGCLASGWGMKEQETDWEGTKGNFWG